MTQHTAESLATLADRELDAIVAELVLGWKWHHRIGSHEFTTWLLPPDTPAEGLQYGPVGPFEIVSRPNWPTQSRAAAYLHGEKFSTTWEGMKQIVEGMRESGWGFVLDAGLYDEDPEAYFYRSAQEMLRASAESHPRAVAIAAVLAVQHFNEPSK